MSPSFCATGSRWSCKSPLRPPGLGFNLDQRPSASLMHFQMNPDEMRTFLERLPQP